VGLLQLINDWFLSLSACVFQAATVLAGNNLIAPVNEKVKQNPDMQNCNSLVPYKMGNVELCTSRF